MTLTILFVVRLHLADVDRALRAARPAFSGKRTDDFEVNDPTQTHIEFRCPDATGSDPNAEGMRDAQMALEVRLETEKIPFEIVGNGRGGIATITTL